METPKATTFQNLGSSPMHLARTTLRNEIQVPHQGQTTWKTRVHLLHVTWYQRAVQ